MMKLYVGNQLVYSPEILELQLQNVQVSLELNKSGTLSFTMTSLHPLYDIIDKLNTYIDLFMDDEFISRFRVLNIQDDFYKNRQIECEGELAFLVDSIQYPFSYEGSISNLLTKILGQHNEQVEVEKQIHLGKCEFDNTIAVSSENYVNSLVCMQDNLISIYGGYLRIRHTQSITYLDYIQDYHHICDQTIRFGENLLDITKYIHGENIKTAVIALGAKQDDDGSYLTITSVNDGKDYVYDEQGVEQWGWIWDVQNWDDINDPSELKRKAESYLNDMIGLETTLELTSLDLHMVDVNIERICLGDQLTIISAPHQLDKLFLVTKLEFNSDQPADNKIMVGSTIKTFTLDTKQSSESMNKKIKGVKIESHNDIDVALQRSTGKNGGNYYLEEDASLLPIASYYMDSKQREIARNIMKMDKDGITCSTSGIQGTFEKVMDIDGTIHAEHINGSLGGWTIYKNHLTASYDYEVDTNYSVIDLERIEELIHDSSTITDNERIRYDLDFDGFITQHDYHIIQNIIEGKYETTWHIKITVAPFDIHHVITIQVDRGSVDDEEQVNYGISSMKKIHYLETEIKDILNRITLLENEKEGL